jgi:hypothetical protein
MAARGLIEPYAMAPPPAAIIYDYRLALYLRDFPEVAAYATTHYVPVYRNLWVPGMTGILASAAPHPGPLPAKRGEGTPETRGEGQGEGRRSRITWVAPRAGTYEIWASEALLTHPWLTKPLEYAAIEGPLATRYVIPLARLPRTPVDITVDGVPQPKGTRSLTLRSGSRVELASARRTGILLVPRGIGALCIGTAEAKVF